MALPGSISRVAPKAQGELARERVASVSPLHITPGRQELDAASFMRRRRIVDNVLRWGMPVLLLIAWQIASSNNVINRRFWPPPIDIARAGWDMIESGSLQKQLFITLKRLFVGYAVGASLGVLSGFVLGMVRWMRVGFGPLIYALYTVPKLALLPVLLLVFGIGEAPTIILIGLMVFLMTSIATTDAVLQVPGTYLEAAESFGSTRPQMLRHVIFPAIVPSMIVSLRLAAGIAILVVIGVEFVHGGGGMGYLIWQSWQLFMAPRMYVGIVVVAVLGVAFQAIVGSIGRRLAPWTASTRGGTV